MLTISVWLLSIATAAGTILVLWHMRGSRPPLLAGIAHGIAGILGLAALLLVLRGPPRGVAMGAGSFGPMSGWLLGGAVASGAALLILRRKAPAVVMAVHGGLAVTGYVLFMAWYSVG